MFGKNQPATKKVPLIKKDYECCQCHKKMANIYIEPKEEENFLESYPMCWPCFLKLCNDMRELKKKQEEK